MKATEKQKRQKKVAKIKVHCSRLGQKAGKGNHSTYKKDCLRRRQKHQEKVTNRVERGKIPSEPRTGYLHIYKANVTARDVEFARLQQTKLTTMLSIYSDDKNHYKIDEYLKNRQNWPDTNEAKWNKFTFTKREPINRQLTLIRKAVGWNTEKSQKQTVVEGNQIDTYNCYTTLSYLKFLNDKYRIKAWVFSKNNSNGKCFKLTNFANYTETIHKDKCKAKLIVFDPFLASQCIKLANKLGHRIEYIYNEDLIPKFETKPIIKRRKTYEGVGKISFENDPEKQRLVCITDGITVVRIKKYLADERVKRYPSLHYCEKYVYYQYLKELAKSKVKKLYSTSPKGTRKQRRLVKQKRKLYSRNLVSQFEPTFINKDGVEKGARTIIHRLRKQSRQQSRIKRDDGYKPRMKRRKRVPVQMYKQVEHEVQGIRISKFPYNQPITVIYTRTGKDKIVYTTKEENVKISGNRVVKEDPKTNKSVVICPVKDIIEWVQQKDYSHDDKIKTNWIPFVTVVPLKRTKIEKVEFHIPRKIKKTKQWEHPIKEPNYLGRLRRDVVPF